MAYSGDSFVVFITGTFSLLQHDAWWLAHINNYNSVHLGLRMGIRLLYDQLGWVSPESSGTEGIYCLSGVAFSLYLGTFK